jgi:hypothetical protein
MSAEPVPTKPAEPLEPVTAEQRAALDAWRRGGLVDSPQVAALRKRARGEPATRPSEYLLLVEGVG